MAIRKSGGNDGEATPVPIPNTEVKLSSVDGTWTAGSWESRSPPGIDSSIAQSVEHAAVNRRGVGSSPTWGAILYILKRNDDLLMIIGRHFFFILRIR